MSEETITIKKESLWKYTTFVLLALLVVGAIVFFTKGDSTGYAVNTGTNPSPSGVTAANVDADDDAVLGDSDAPVTIIEFSDYECPYCGKHYTETYPQLKREYIDTGKVKLVFRDFPLSFHPNALPAALAAECVKEKGGDDAYFAYHDILFENQATLSTANMKAWADELGYNIDSCLDSQKYADEVREDTADGSAAGVQGTPSFFINGRQLSGAQPYSAFKQAIDAALA
ncbi:DsbA family protein [Candidatus Pacearchaeota archaeon]|nr:DsbA family protein [Candidatus Pacearchaeota archaeon]